MNAKNIGKLLRDQKKTLAVAESCTGGLLGSLITDVPGSSDYFLGGIIAYHDRVKITGLGVKREVLEKYGAVSPQVAASMAKNIRKKLGASLGVGITGIAGPAGGSKTKPVGLVYIAVSGTKNVLIEKKLFRGTRQKIKVLAAGKALDLLRFFLMSD